MAVAKCIQQRRTTIITEQILTLHRRELSANIFSYYLSIRSLLSRDWVLVEWTYRYFQKTSQQGFCAFLVLSLKAHYYTKI